MIAPRRASSSCAKLPEQFLETSQAGLLAYGNTVANDRFNISLAELLPEHTSPEFSIIDANRARSPNTPD